jgi:predicted nucleic acid-binding protein
MILLDTTVLVYAVGSDHPLRAPCREVVAAIGRGELAATTTVEVIQEFVHVRARRRSRADARITATRFVDLLSPLVEPNADDLLAGLALFERHESLGAFDGVLAATVLNRVQLSGLMSADRAFADVEGLRLLDPATGD